MINKIASDTIFNFIEFVVTLIIYLITTKILIAELGVNGYGFYMFFSSLVSTFALLDVGMGMAVSKYCSEYIHKKLYDSCNQVISAAFLFYTVVILLVLIAVTVASERLLDLFNFDESFRSQGYIALLITTATFAVSLLLTLPLSILVAYEKWKPIVLGNIFSKISAACVLVGILLSDYESSVKITSSVSLLLFLAVSRFLIYIYFANRSYAYFRFAMPDSNTNAHLKAFLRWSSIQYALSSLVGHIDKIIISRYFGLEILGVYSFVVNAFAYLYGLMSTIFKIFFPKLSKLHGVGDRQKLIDLSIKLMKAVLISSAFISLLAVLVWEPFISYYIDPTFATNSFGYFVLFAIYLFVRSPEIIIAYFFNATAKPIALVVNVAIGSITTLTTYFILVPTFNAHGLILAQICGTLAIYLFLAYQYHKYGTSNL